MTESAPEQLPAAAWHSLPKELQDLAERPEELGGNDILGGGFQRCFYVHPENWGKIPILTIVFQRG